MVRRCSSQRCIVSSVGLGLLQTQISRLTYVQTSRICGVKENLVSTNIPRSFVVGEYIKLIPYIAKTGKMGLGRE